MLADESTDALQALRAFFDQLRRFHQQGRKGFLVGNLGAELGDGSQAIGQAMSEALRDWRDRFERILDRAQRQGTVRKDIAAARLADFLLNTFEGALIRMKVERKAEPLEEFRSMLLGTFFRP